MMGLNYFTVLGSGEDVQTFKIWGRSALLSPIVGLWLLSYSNHLPFSGQNIFHSQDKSSSIIRTYIE